MDEVRLAKIFFDSYDIIKPLCDDHSIDFSLLLNKAAVYTMQACIDKNDPTHSKSDMISS